MVKEVEGNAGEMVTEGEGNTGIHLVSETEKMRQLKEEIRRLEDEKITDRKFDEDLRCRRSR